MFNGVFCILGACLCWAAVFVIPAFLPEFTALEVSLGRFFFFGLFSTALLFFRKRYLLQKLYLPIWKKATIYGLISTLVCYTLTVVCIQYANSATAALLFGTVPIIVALIGNLRKKEFPFKAFIFPCLIMAVGIGLVNKDAFYLQEVDLFSYAIGTLSGVLGVGCWIWYVLACFDFMEKSTEISSIDWVTMLGSAVFFIVISLVGILSCGEGLRKYLSWNFQMQNFFIGSLILGLISSWLALYLWTKGNLKLPISMVGQLAIFELIFGLTLIYWTENRFPLREESVGICLMMFGVLKGFYTLRKLSPKALE